VDSFEKNYREKKTRQGDKETGREGNGADRDTVILSGFENLRP
jgi:hypothetical protein